MVVSCPHCRTRLKVGDHLAGRRGLCPACKTAITIPQPPASPTSASAGLPPIPAGGSDAAGSSPSAKPPPLHPVAKNRGSASQHGSPVPADPASNLDASGGAGPPPIVQIQNGNRVSCPWCKKVFGVTGAGSKELEADPANHGAGSPPTTAETPAEASATDESAVPPPLPPRAKPKAPVVEHTPAAAVNGADGLSVWRQAAGGFTVAFKGGLNADQMRALKTYARKYSPATFGLAVLCFVLPFTHVSCQGERVTSFSGLQLVVGTDLSTGDMEGLGDFGGASRQRVDPEPFAILALAAAIAGVALSFLKNKRRRAGGIVAGAVGAVMLLLLKLRIDHKVAAEGEGMLQVAYGSGYYLAFLVFVGAAVLHVYLFMEAKRQARDARRPGPT